MEVGIKIRKLRELKNLTQEHMAIELDMTQGAYSKIESGESELVYSKLEKIANILGLRPEDILTFNEHVVLNVMHNQNVNGVTGSNFYQVPEEVKRLYEEQILILKEQNEYLKNMLEKVLSGKP